LGAGDCRRFTLRSKKRSASSENQKEKKKQKQQSTTVASKKRVSILSSQKRESKKLEITLVGAGTKTPPQLLKRGIGLNFGERKKKKSVWATAKANLLGPPWRACEKKRGLGNFSLYKKSPQRALVGYLLECGTPYRVNLGWGKLLFSRKKLHSTRRG